MLSVNLTHSEIIAGRVKDLPGELLQRFAGRAQMDEDDRVPSVLIISPVQDRSRFNLNGENQIIVIP